MHLPPETPLRGLLRCFDAAFFIPSFEDEGLSTLGDLRALGDDGAAEFLAALCMPRDTGARLLGLAFVGDAAGDGDCASQDAAQGAAALSDLERRLPLCAGAMSPAWLRAISPLYSQHMGCENMGPLLYSLARFVKPRSCLEIGSGYTSAFLLQALEDNEQEVGVWRDWQRERQVAGGGGQAVPWVVDEALATDGGGVLHCVDNLAHSGTTAHHVVAVAEQLGIGHRLRLHLDDASGFVDDLPDSGPGSSFDLVWLDGLLDFAPPRRSPPEGGRWGDEDSRLASGLDHFLGRVWPRVAPGGIVALHSTVTNSVVRGWLQRLDQAKWGPPGALFSLLEPHKRFQNSTTLLQRRPEGFAEPVYSKLP